MSKPMILIVRSRYPHKKHIKTNYESQSPNDPVLNDKIRKKKSIKKHIKRFETTQVNLLRIILKS